MMNGTMTAQRPVPIDYHTGRASVPPALGGRWYPDDPTRSLLVDIPSASPGGLRHSQRPLSASTQHLLTVSTPPPPSTETSAAVNPELRQAQKSGDVYNISLNLNALQLAARPHSAASNTSMRRTRSMQNLAANMTYRPLSTTPYDDQEAGTTVVQVRRDNEEPSPQTMQFSLSTSETTHRHTKSVTRSPPARTLHIPPSPSRRSRSASRMSQVADEGYVIKSLKSTDEKQPSGRVSNAPVAGDSKIVFDVELMQQQQQQQQRQWGVEQAVSRQHVVDVASSGRRSLMIESVRPSSTLARQLDPPMSVTEPTYTMTVNQQMTMNYEPPVLSPQPPQQDIPDESARQRALHAESSRTTTYDVTNASNGYPPGEKPPPTAAAVKKKKPSRMTSSGTQMSFDKSTQMRPKTRNSSDEEPVNRSKKPITMSPRKTPEPRMVSKATQMAVNKSTQIAKLSSEDEDGATDSDMEPRRARTMMAGKAKKKKPKDSRKQLTNVGVQVMNLANMMDDRRRESEFDLVRPGKAQNVRSGPPRRPIDEYQDDNQPPWDEDAIQPRRTTRVEALPNWPDNDDLDRPASRPRQQQLQPGQRLGDDYRPSSRRSQDPDAYIKRPPYGQDFVDLNADPRGQSRDPYQGNAIDDYVAPSSAGRQQAQPQYPSDAIQPRRTTRVEALPNWPDNDDLDRPASRPRQQQLQPGQRLGDDYRPSSRRSQDPDAYIKRPPGYQSPYGQDFVDFNADPRGQSRDSYQGNAIDDYVAPSSAGRQQAQPQYPSDAYASDGEEDLPKSRGRLYADPSFTNDNVGGARGQDQFADSRVADRLDGGGYGPVIGLNSRGDGRWDPYSRNGGARDSPVDPYRYASIPVMSEAFDDQDEAYLQQQQQQQRLTQQRLANANAAGSSNASARRSFQARSATAARRQTNQEEAKGEYRIAYGSTENKKVYLTDHRLETGGTFLRHEILRHFYVGACLFNL